MVPPPGGKFKKQIKKKKNSCSKVASSSLANGAATCLGPEGICDCDSCWEGSDQSESVESDVLKQTQNMILDGTLDLQHLANVMQMGSLESTPIKNSNLEIPMFT